MLKARAPHLDLTIADPSEAMLALASHPKKILAASQDLPDDIGPFDVITAVQCHHYGGREAAVKRCYELLGEKGVLVVFENVRPETDDGHAVQRARWAAWQKQAGRTPEEITQQLAREGTKFFPIRPSEHLELLRRTGFRTIELFFRAYGQAGFYAVK
jgi:tRNA (cmo5U34)-methyltransferase